MAKQSAKNEKEEKKQVSTPTKTFLGVTFVLVFFYFSWTFYSYFNHWQADQNTVSAFANREIQVENSTKKMGNLLGNLLIYNGFGVSVFFPLLALLLQGIKFLGNLQIKMLSKWLFAVLLMVFSSVLVAFLQAQNSILSGRIGYEINSFLTDYIGRVGVFLLLFLVASYYIIFKFDLTADSIEGVSDRFKNIFKKYYLSKQVIEEEKNNIKMETATKTREMAEGSTVEEIKVDVYTHKDDIPLLTINNQDIDLELVTPSSKEEKPQTITSDLELDVTLPVLEETIDNEVLADKLVTEYGEYDPTLELSGFENPSLTLLSDYNDDIIRDDEELKANQDLIIKTLRDFKIEITKMSATIGPTVTLYEVVPASGVKISRIKNLEDDIAMSIAATGIRIIAPIPGKGTVGIEVPNKKTSVVSMKSVLSSAKFQKSNMELPIAFGRTITNEPFVVDLAKMPHLLMAGATGQGKSVGLNAILTSLLYKKHPSEVKLILVDPKKVELSLYSKIERHYLAKLPDADDAILTDNSKVISTLNSVCAEMDNRYALLKAAFVRNIQQYNEKFKKRKLNPEQGHQFLPYIVLVVDEFADLIMTAGKEIELPIARLAQLARAVGIHLIIATQRPSVSVITGLIKANFPTRVAFKVSSKMDSRIILDTAGADRLIGRGDMLYTQGNDLIRLQCAFIDTPEVEKIADFIGTQKGFSDAFMLPEVEETSVVDFSSASQGGNNSERDQLFRQAAEVVVSTQQGSASTLQRKLQVGYARAGKLIDQLEAAGIVGKFNGSKAREVLITDLYALEQFFNTNQ